MRFNPRPPHGGRPAPSRRPCPPLGRFNPRPPHGGRHDERVRWYAGRNVSIRAPRTGGDIGCRVHAGDGLVSIRAPRTGGDGHVRDGRTQMPCFNPRPRTGGDEGRGSRGEGVEGFQSAPPARGATAAWQHPRHADVSFNPRPPHGGRRRIRWRSIHDSHVSIRAPRTGGDRTCRPRSRPRSCFNPRPPHGGRLSSPRSARRRISGFNPRPPHGGRQPGFATVSRAGRFQSAPPARGATRQRLPVHHHADVSIRAPRTGGDHGEDDDCLLLGGFNPRPPHGGRLSLGLIDGEDGVGFNPRPPHGGRLERARYAHEQAIVSIRAPRTGGDSRSAGPGSPPIWFQSAPPARGATWSAPSSRREDMTVSIRAPRTGGDPADPGPKPGPGQFQSAPPARGATCRPRTRRAPPPPGFDPRPPHGGRRHP